MTSRLQADGGFDYTLGCARRGHPRGAAVAGLDAGRRATLVRKVG